ncbi:MAG: ABC transporter ATP-binding protein [Phycisphaerae bacterium]|nr:ABC transporter ATP-binding protein [Phycisphaerae bacterium]
MYSLTNVQKHYTKRGQQVTALCDVSLEIESGEYLALVGASGSGKTTLLSILGAMLAPSDGVLHFDGQSLYQMTVRERASLRRQRFGFVFQTFNLIPYLTALENVQAPMMLCGIPKADQACKAAGLLDRFDLGDRMHHRPSELSVGQQQRVALARTLANDPRIILADEPTGNLDPQTRDVVLATLDSFHREGRTIIVVTHDPAVAKRAQRRLSLSSGSIVDDSSCVLSKCA